jgi:hypothetical protein
MADHRPVRSMAILQGRSIAHNAPLAPTCTRIRCRFGPDLVDAVRDGRIQVWAVSRIEDVLELSTGIPRARATPPECTQRAQSFRWRPSACERSRKRRRLLPRAMIGRAAKLAHRHGALRSPGPQDLAQTAVAAHPESAHHHVKEWGPGRNMGR